MSLFFLTGTQLPIRALLKGVPPSLTGRVFVMGNLKSSVRKPAFDALRAIANDERTSNPHGWKEALRSFYQLLIIMGKRVFVTPVSAQQVHDLQARTGMPLPDAVFEAAQSFDGYLEDLK